VTAVEIDKPDRGRARTGHRRGRSVGLPDSHECRRL